VRLIWLTVLCLSLAAPAVIAVAQTKPRVINVTTDSAPDWIPSEELEAEALSTLDRYFVAFGKGDDHSMWNLSTEGLKSLTTFAEFQSDRKAMRGNLGRLEKLSVLKITWTKDPARAPAKGIYAAIDISGRFSKTKRHCGYVILFKANSTDPFGIARIENNYFTDKDAKKIAKDQSPAEVERLWSRVSSNCPNYENPFATVK
jgi:hypothetical protein